MTFAREGLPYIAGATALAVITFAVSLRRRSWPLWLVGLSLVVVALIFSYVFRDVAASSPIGQLPPR